MENYLIKIITDEDDFIMLKTSWNELVSRDSDSTIFQLWEWNYNIWEYINRHNSNLCILVIHKKADGLLVGIVPFCLRIQKYIIFKVKILEFIGNPYLDNKNFIIDDRYKSKINHIIVKWITQRIVKWDIVDLKPMNEDLVYKMKFKNLMDKNDLKVKIIDYIKSPFLLLDKNKSIYDHLVDTSFLKFLKRKLKKIQKDYQCTYFLIKNEDELSSYFHIFVRLNKLRSHDKVQRGIFRNKIIEEMFSEICRQMLKLRMLNLYFILLNDKPAACLLNFQFNNKIYFYQSGFDISFKKYSVGYLIHHYALQKALENGSTEYDFLNGEENYKSQFTNHFRQMVQVKIIHSILKNIFVCLYEAVIQYIYEIRILKQIYLVFYNIMSKKNLKK
jgi:hypothetical protein